MHGAKRKWDLCSLLYLLHNVLSIKIIDNLTFTIPKQTSLKKYIFLLLNTDYYEKFQLFKSQYF